MLTMYVLLMFLLFFPAWHYRKGVHNSYLLCTQHDIMDKGVHNTYLLFTQHDIMEKRVHNTYLGQLKICVSVTQASLTYSVASRP